MFKENSTRVWQIHELAALITQCTFCRQPTEGLQARGCATLVALARVNRLLSEIALRDIWKVLDSGSPLVSLLPRDFEALVDPAEAKKRMIKELEQLRAVTARDLERYMKYSSYVHVLDISNDSDVTCQFLEKADRFVFQLRLNDHHFTKLWSLTVSPCRLMDPQSYLKMRGNRDVRSLKMVLDNTVQRSWLEAVGGYFSSISSLKILSVDATINATSLQPDFSIVLDGLVRLQVLKMVIGLETLYTLLLKIGRLPLLKQLGLRIPRGGAQDHSFSKELALERPMEPHKSLELDYEGQPGVALLHILALSRLFSISYWSIHCISVPLAHPGHMEMLLRWMTSQYSCVPALAFSDRLRPLPQVVERGLRSTNPQLAFAIMPSTIIHLAGFSKLQALKLDTFWGSALSPEFLATLATSLKLLEKCSFKTYRLLDRKRNPTCSITLTHVIKFALQCANLRYLAVCCDARKSNGPLPDLAVIADSSSKLTVFGVGQSMIDDAEHVVKVLRTSFPTLRRVIPGPDLESGVDSSLLMTHDEMINWRKVGRTIGGGGPSTS